MGTEVSQSARNAGVTGTDRVTQRRRLALTQPADRNTQGEDPRCPPRDSHLTHVYTHG